MKVRKTVFAMIFCLVALGCLPITMGSGVAAGQPFPGRKSSFHSYDRYDFRHKDRKCIVVTPRSAAKGRPWIWRARFFGHQPQTDIALLGKGFHVVYVDVAGLFGCPKAVAIWDEFYKYLTETHGFAKKAVLEGMSRGGLIVYNWASKHPENVYCIYVDAPVCDIKSWPGGKGIGKGHPASWVQCLRMYGLTEEQAMVAKCNPIDNLEALAKAKVPLLHIVGDADKVVPVAENTAIVEKIYKELNGNIKVIHKKNAGHHPHSLNPPTLIVDFILKHVTAGTSAQPMHPLDNKQPCIL